MVISGLYIVTINGKAELAANEINKLPGVEVHHVEGNKIVLAIETVTLEESYKLADSFKKVDGVLAICLVYSNFEDEPYYKGEQLL